jgi:hypothetical protein
LLLPFPPPPGLDGNGKQHANVEMERANGYFGGIDGIKELFVMKIKGKMPRQ